MTLFDFQRQFSDEQTCTAYLEQQRWGEGAKHRSCPHCSSAKSYKFSDSKRYKCATCRKQFTVTVGTIFEGSHVPLQKWFYAAFLNTSLKKGISSIQLAKYLGITQKSAWFMLQRIRYGFEVGGDGTLLSNVVEMDETYIGGLEQNKHASKRIKGAQGGGSVHTKAAVVGILERKGELKLLTAQATDTPTLHGMLQKNVAKGSTVISDTYRPYRSIKKLGYVSLRVDHSRKEYVKGTAHTNSVEGTWAHLKLSIRAIYMGVSKKHLQKYCAEYEYRYSRRGMDDGARFNKWFGYCKGHLAYSVLIADK